MRAGKLTLSLSGCGTQESGPVPLLSSTVELTLVEGVSGKLTLKTRDSWPCHLSAIRWPWQKEMSFTPLPLAIGSSQES